MRDLLIAFVVAGFGFWLLATNDVNDASGGQFIVAWIAIALGVGFAAFAALERLP